MLGEEANLNASAHLKGAEPEPLMDTEEDCLLKVEEDGAIGKAASVEGDISPCVELQDPGVSCLATQEDAGSLTLSSSPPPTTLEAASMQRSPAASTGMPNIPVPDHGTDLEPQLPNEAVEYPIHQLPKQSQAPTKVGGLLKSLLGKESQCAMGHRGLTSARTHEGETPIGEAYGHPPNFINPQTQGSTAWEPVSVILKAQVCVLKARRPVFDEGARMHPDPWPSLGIVIVDPDTCSGSASQLEGEQNLFSPSVGGKLHAAPPAPQYISFSPSIPIPSLSDTLVHENLSYGEGAATERHATEGHHPERWKPLNLQAEHLQEAGRVLSALGNIPVILEGPDPLGLVGTVIDIDVREVEPSGIDAHEQGGALLVAGIALALAEGTAGIEPAGKAKKAITARPKALVPWVQDKAKRGCEVNKPPHKALLQKGKRNAEALSCKHKPKHPKALLPGGERECSMMPQGNSNKAQRKPDWLSRELLCEDVLSTWEGQGPWDPGGGPARE